MQDALDALALIASLLAVVFDERARRIPNWLSYGTALLALALRAAWAFGPPLDASVAVAGALGGVTLGAAFGLLSIIGLLGFGDSKLLLGIGLCVGHPLSLELALCVLASGGVVALIQAARQGRLRAVVQGLGQARSLTRERVDEPGGKHKHLFGYALAIALGTLWAVVGRRLPFVLPL